MRLRSERANSARMPSAIDRVSFNVSGGSLNVKEWPVKGDRSATIGEMFGAHDEGDPVQQSCVAEL